jgi:di/tripeptidase
LEALRTLKERNLPHPPLEVVLTIREEKGLLGAKAFDTRLLRARTGLVVDGREDPSALFVQSPTHWKWEVVFHRQGGARRRGTRKGQKRHRDGCQSDCPDGVGTLGRRDDRQCRRD